MLTTYQQIEKKVRVLKLNPSQAKVILYPHPLIGRTGISNYMLQLQSIFKML